MWGIAKKSGRPIHPDLTAAWEWPHTITYVFTTRQRYDSYLELSEPPKEEIWDIPHLIRKHIEELYPSSKKKTFNDVEISGIEQ